MVPVQRFYRFAIWLPILVSGATILGAALVGLPNFGPLNLIAVSLISSGLYGAIPYSLLAIWASWWIRGRGENEIRRLALFMPVLMLGAFLPFAFLIGASDGDPLLGGLFMVLIAIPYILVLGYAYVGLTFWLRSIAGTRKWISSAPVTAA